MKVTFKGGVELQAALRELGSKVTAKNVGKRALLKAAEPIRDRAKALAPDDPATGIGKYLKESIKAAPGKRNRGDRVWALVGIDADVDPPTYHPRQKARAVQTRKFRDGRSPAVATQWRDPGVAGVAGIIEFGRPGVPAKPFMRTAWEAEKAATPDRIATELASEIDKAAARAARKAAKR